MSERMLDAARVLCDALIDFDPAVLSGADCARVAEQLAITEKAVGAARARAGARAVECGVHRERGYSDPMAWMARTSGSSAAQARVALDTAAAIENCPATKAALVSGELSMAQAGEIARVVSAGAPGAEAELVELARGASLSALRDEARKRTLAAVDPEDLHRRQHAARYHRHWRDALGMIRYTGALPPEIGVPFSNRMDAETDRVFRRAHREGRKEPRDAYAADAFAVMVAGAGAGKGRSASTDMVVVCDLTAYRRGHVHDGEVCNIVGGGPIPVALAHHLAEDAFLKAVLHDGVRIDTVAHFGRHINAELRTALELGQPPEFEGAVCAEPGCGRRYGLEWDHDNPRANRGPTSYGNLKPLCRFDHRAKTERDRDAGLLGNDDGRGPP